MSPNANASLNRASNLLALALSAHRSGDSETALALFIKGCDELPEPHEIAAEGAVEMADTLKSAILQASKYEPKFSFESSTDNPDDPKNKTDEAEKEKTEKIRMGVCPECGGDLKDGKCQQCGAINVLGDKQTDIPTDIENLEEQDRTVLLAPPVNKDGTPSDKPVQAPASPSLASFIADLLPARK